MKKIQEILKHNSILLALMALVVVFVISNVKDEKTDNNNKNRILDSEKELNMICPEPEIAFVEVNEINLLMEATDTVRFTEVEINTEEEPTAETVTEEIVTEEIVTEETVTEEPATQTVTVQEVAAPVRVIPCSDADYINLLKIVEAETTGGDLMSKIMVANVIINRVKNPYFPNTITDVIFQGNGEQFQPIMDGRFYTVPVTALTFEAVDRALYGEDYSMGAYFFAATASAAPGSWHDRALKRLFEYGGHVYFTFK